MSLSFDSDSSVSSPDAVEWRFPKRLAISSPEKVFDLITALEFDKNGDHLAVGDRGGRVVIFKRDGGKDEVDELTSRHELEKLDGALLKHPTYQYKTEFQSHEPDVLTNFDSLRSIEIEEKINKIRWCASSNGSLCLLSTNDKTLKLWRVKDHEAKQVTEMEIGQSVSSDNSLLAEKSFINGQTTNASNSNSLELTENVLNGVSYNGGNKNIAYLEDATRARCRRVYAHAHDFNVNSISVNRGDHSSGIPPISL